MRKSSPAKDIRSYFHGTVVDRVMRAWLNSDDPRPGEMPQMVEDFVRQCELDALTTGDGVVRWRNKNDKALMTNFCRELVTKLEPFLFELVLPYEYQPELRYRTPIWIPYLDGTPTMVYLAGGIDILVRRPADDEFHAYDLKGTANDKYISSVIGQGIFYDLSIYHMYGQHPKTFGFIQPMCKEPLVYANITDDDRKAMMARVMRMAANMWQRDFEPKKDSKGCTMCPVNHACPKYAIAGSPTPAVA